jgi:nucleoside-diphosphate-sugar epimerase
MRVLITGGTGFIGRPLVRGALRRGWEVTILTRRPHSPEARELAGEGARLVVGDLADRASLRAAFEVSHPEIVFHNAGWYELGIPARARRRRWSVNVEGTETVLSLAAEAVVKRVVYTSSTTALGDTGGITADESFERKAPMLSYYERTKTEAHAIALRHQRANEPVVIACPAQAVAPGDHSPFGVLARLFVRRRLPPFTWAPEGAFTFGHVEDVAEAIVLAGEKGRSGATYFVAGTQLSNVELMRVWGEATGLKPPFVWLPRPLAMAQASLAAPLLRAVGQTAFLSPEVVRSSYVSFRYSSQRAIRELGASFRPAETTWAETLREEMRRTRAG